MSDIAIRVDHLGKQYCLGGQKTAYTTFREVVVDAIKAPKRWVKGERSPDRNLFWALDDISFDVKVGEAIGIIGRNGAGKSTLLKILSRITRPTRGRVDIYGRVGSLLEVGTGFHPELTGRENIFLNGAILGMSRTEITRKFDEIVDFSGVDRFLDTPVKFYSSGMYVRLAFAVAAHLEPEILVVDEVLAVGDASFQKKCLGKMGEVTRGGRTVLFVSHQMDMIRSLCSIGILLEKGNINVYGSVNDVVDSYIQNIRDEKQMSSFMINDTNDISIKVISGKVVDENENENGLFDVFSKIALELTYIISKPVEGAVVNFELKRNGTTLFISFDTDEDIQNLNPRIPGIYVSRIEIPSPLLKPGNYSISIKTGIINVLTFQQLDNILSFNVELLSRPSSLLSYAEKRNGIIAVPIKWKTQRAKPGNEVSLG